MRELNFTAFRLIDILLNFEKFKYNSFKNVKSSISSFFQSTVKIPL